MNDASFTHRPGPGPHQGALEALVYVRQTCTTHPLPASGKLRLGRGADNDIRIDDQSVSRYHLLIHVGEGIEVEDLGSANGTLLFRVDPEDTLEAPTRRNEPEARLRGGERRALEPGDFVRAGSALIMVQSRRPNSTRNGRALSIAPPGEGPAVLLDPEMKRAYEIALRAAQSGISVLITGETGSGKEVFAETIHQRSTRRGKPFLRLNCAALSESLLESQLFGHERGAFTGANQTKTGLLESTDQGTVFLDEIGEMPLSIQAKLLRVLEERSVLRVGATKPRPIDVRFVWATNRDLRVEVQAGRFRNDLYYRIAGVEFSIPPLRRRPLEIEPLARLFLRRFCERSGLPMPELTAEALQALHAYSWPGNVRELKNIMERAPFLCENGLISAAQIPQQPLNALDVDEFPVEEQDRTQVFAPLRMPKFSDTRALAEPPSSARPHSVPSRSVPSHGVPSRSVPSHGVPSHSVPSHSVPSHSVPSHSVPSHSVPSYSVPSYSVPSHNEPSLPAIDSEEERQRVLRALEQCGGNQTRAAKLLGVSRRTLINRVERLNLPRPKKT